jgi:DNA-binding transcriptional LysR family regulator
MTDLILKQSGTAIHLDRVYETDMAEGLKVMAVEGHGIAFLPHSAVKKELRARRLVPAAAPEQGLEITMEVRAYRERPSGRDAPKRTVQALWEYLRAGPASLAEG